MRIHEVKKAKDAEAIWALLVSSRMDEKGKKRAHMGNTLI